MSNPSTSDTSTCAKSLKALKKNLHILLNSAEKDNSSEFNLKIQKLKASLDHLRENVQSIGDVGRTLEQQQQKIDDLQRQIEIKNNFIRKFKEELDSSDPAPESMET
ncbi:RNA polymerase II transcription mediator complex subunit 9 domain-containing protein [Ditylenchus destructor]|nr:RNA polymerase II transcription mediator complex subunit 9 domain-containing protein [Ditylenchus destructor]